MLAYVVDTSGQEHNSYDERGRVEWTIKRVPDPLLQVSNASPPLVAYRTGFQYDSMDRVTRLTYPDNDQVTYEYNPRGLLQRIIGGPTGSMLSNQVYTPSAQKQQVGTGDGVQTAYGYDSRERLVSLASFPVARPGAQLINFGYTFDGASNIKGSEDRRDSSLVPSTDPRRNSQAFSYDDLYRLTRVQYNLPAASTNNGGQIQYRYDRIGNMLSATSDLNQQERGVPVANLGALLYGGSLGSSSRTGRNPGEPAGPHALTSIQSRSPAINPGCSPMMTTGT
jgi:YD repeat-containing protein